MKPSAVIPAALGAVAFLVAGVIAGDDPLVLARLTVCGGALASAAASDLREHRIPNRLVLPALALCAALSAASAPAAGGLIAGAAIVGLLLVVSLVWPRALGMGDVKLAALVLAGLDGSAARAIALGLILAALAGLAAIARQGRGAGKQSLPLAPFIAAGSLLAVLT